MPLAGSRDLPSPDGDDTTRASSASRFSLIAIAGRCSPAAPASRPRRTDDADGARLRRPRPRRSDRDADARRGRRDLREPDRPRHARRLHQRTGLHITPPADFAAKMRDESNSLSGFVRRGRRDLPGGRRLHRDRDLRVGALRSPLVGDRDCSRTSSTRAGRDRHRVRRPALQPAAELRRRHGPLLLQRHRDGLRVRRRAAGRGAGERSELGATRRADAAPASSARRSSCAPIASSTSSPPGRPISCTPIGRPLGGHVHGQRDRGQPAHVHEAGERRVLHLLREVAHRVLGVVPADRPRRHRQRRGQHGVEARQLADDAALELGQPAERGRQLARAEPASGLDQPARQRLDLVELLPLDRDAGRAALPERAERGGVALLRLEARTPRGRARSRRGARGRRAARRAPRGSTTIS